LIRDLAYALEAGHQPLQLQGTSQDDLRLHLRQYRQEAGKLYNVAKALLPVNHQALAARISPIPLTAWNIEFYGIGEFMAPF
jgi:hypothetical protein